MKNLLLIFSVLLSTSLSAVEYGYLEQGGQSSISLNQGDVIEFLGASQGVDIKLYLPSGNEVVIESTYLGSSYSFYPYNSKKNNVFVGPIDISLWSTSASNIRYLAYKLTRASEYQNSNVFSVNGDSSSTHNIVVETSTDLENWTPVHSSGLTGSSEQIYVRTRISTSE